MSPEELHKEWMSGEENGLRPKRIQTVRDDIMEHTGLFVPRRLPEIESWLSQQKSQITRKVKKLSSENE